MKKSNVKLGLSKMTIASLTGMNAVKGGNIPTRYTCNTDCQCIIVTVDHTCACKTNNGCNTMGKSCACKTNAGC